MTRSVFTQTLKEQRRGLIGWSIGLSIVPMMYLPSYQSLRDQGTLDIGQNAMYDAMGLSDFASATGYLNSTVFSLMGLLLMVIFAITFATRSVTQEENGMLDLLLAQPIGRKSLLAQRFAALAVQTAVVTTVLTLSVLAGANSGGLNIATGHIVAASAGLGLLSLLIGAITLMLGAATGKRALTLGSAALVTVAGYLANNLGGMFDGGEWLRRLSPFYYANGDSPLVNGANPVHLAVLVALAAVAVAVALAAFERRDLAV
ncbi:ABC-2 type transport system permease protein [Nocardia amikacinitolerans]|uniref:ABC-2 type transport system permease protein n=1 Tax=Nocardia amikacinitolerans TaxID=756689 RepID=A0A285LY08_9NOCA|nr:ABC transporter permease subunit [Nocardia amikacinitolerans]MCP2298102.1 ABC-2 type transport system permease protein [Nocardia amikacinitolerans]SNY89353.1 ABC-2 type transport system permease protein [Nocardia amikacinitolerans]